MVFLNICKPIKDDRSFCDIKTLPLIQNGTATFFFSEYGVRLEDAYPYALNLSRALGRKLVVTGDIAFFKSKYPEVKGTLELS